MTAADAIPELLTLAEVARRLRIHPLTLRKDVDSGRLPVVTIGQRKRVRADDLARYLSPVQR